MKQRWEKLASRFNALKPRERGMVFFAGVALIVALGFALVFDAALARQKLVATSLGKHAADLAQLQKQNAELSRTLAENPDAQGRKRIEQMQQQLAGYDSELRGVQQGLVPPGRMVRLLEDMLSRDGHVQLVKLHTLPVAALVETANPAATESSVSKSGGPAKTLVYKHGIELTVEGGYLDLLEYQARLERLPWRMFFARTRIDSTDYPRVLMTITLYTLSLEEAWLVV